MSDIDTAVVDSLKVLDPRRPIREEADNIYSQQVSPVLTQKRTLAVTLNFSELLRSVKIVNRNHVPRLGGCAPDRTDWAHRGRQHFTQRCSRRSCCNFRIG